MSYPRTKARTNYCVSCHQVTTSNLTRFPLCEHNKFDFSFCKEDGGGVGGGGGGNKIRKENYVLLGIQFFLNYLLVFLFKYLSRAPHI